MPELPEVESIRNTLRTLVAGKTIADVRVRWPRIIKRPDDAEAFRMRLIGETIQDIGRRGKFLLFILDRHVLVSHLRMEGKYRLESPTDPIDKHTHVIFSLTDGTELRYRDVRKFGTMHLFDKGEERVLPPLAGLGSEPFDERFDADYLKDVFSKTERNIKAVLLDQTTVVGLGNIYVDESLFRAGIHPLEKAKHLSDDDIRRLEKSIKDTLAEAVALGGSSVRSYLNGYGEMGMFQLRLYVYGRQGQPCKACGAMIEKTKAAGRGTHYCPKCQRRRSP